MIKGDAALREQDQFQAERLTSRGSRIDAMRR